MVKFSVSLIFFALAFFKRLSKEKNTIIDPITETQIERVKLTKELISKGILTIDFLPEDLNLKANEYLIYSDETSLYEEKTRRQYGGASVRIVRGLYLHRGSSKGHPKIDKIDTGNLYLTTKRLIFTGCTSTRISELSKIVTITAYNDYIIVNREGKSKSEIYELLVPQLFKTVWDAITSDSWIKVDDMLMKKSVYDTEKAQKTIEFESGNEDNIELSTNMEELEDIEDPLYEEAIVFAKTNPKVAVLDLQRKLKIGYGRARSLYIKLIEDEQFKFNWLLDLIEIMDVDISYIRSSEG